MGDVCGWSGGSDQFQAAGSAVPAHAPLMSRECVAVIEGGPETDNDSRRNRSAGTRGVRITTGLVCPAGGDFDPANGRRDLREPADPAGVMALSARGGRGNDAWIGWLDCEPGAIRRPGLARGGRNAWAM